jgi:hypothetical protein
MSLIGIDLFNRSALALLAVLGFANPAVAATAVPIDANLYTTYEFNGPNSLNLATCGSTGNVQGCFGSVSLTGLSNPCAVLQGPSTTKGNTVTREVYVLQTGTDAKPNVTMKVFRLTLAIKPATVILPSTVIPSAALLRNVPIPFLIGGSTLTCYMAANAGFVFFGTSNATLAVKFSKENFVAHTFRESVPPRKLVGITANEAGYVTISFDTNGQTSFAVFNPAGTEIGFGGGGPYFMPNQTNAVKLN